MPEPMLRVPVWDATVRIAHWWMAIGVMLVLPLGLLLWLREALGLDDAVVESLTDLHAALGFALAAGVVVRVAYLFAGPVPGHWRDLLPLGAARRALAAATLRWYLRRCRGEPPLYRAHNPLAGLAYAALFLLLAAQVVTGTVMYLFGGGGTAWAAAGDGAAEWPPEWLVEVHEVCAFLVLAYVLAHLLALAVHELAERRGLISSMVSGDKFFTREELASLEAQEDEA